jgi:hypothetical protein
LDSKQKRNLSANAQEVQKLEQLLVNIQQARQDLSSVTSLDAKHKSALDTMMETYELRVNQRLEGVVRMSRDNP